MGERPALYPSCAPHGDIQAQGAPMFKLKELLDGVIEDILELPATWVRTHYYVLRHGPRAPFVIAHRIARGDKRYLRLRTAAFLDALIIYALSQATNTTKVTFG